MAGAHRTIPRPEGPPAPENRNRFLFLRFLDVVENLVCPSEGSRSHMVGLHWRRTCSRVDEDTALSLAFFKLNR
jgi:hypothetical protein